MLEDRPRRPTEEEGKVFVLKEGEGENVIVISWDKMLEYLDGDWEVKEELNDNVFLMRKISSPETSELGLVRLKR